MNTNLVEYYKRRAKEYDRLYERADRQDCLNEASEILKQLVASKNVLEIGCGTGYWTERIAQTATSLLATDINEEVIAIAQQRNYPAGKVKFRLADYNNINADATYNCLFAGFIWSHISVVEQLQFLLSLSKHLEPGSEMIFMDNRFVEGSNTPIAETDEHGNTYQHRVISDGSTHKVMKNFTGEESLKILAAKAGFELKYYSLDYYWIATFRII